MTLEETFTIEVYGCSEDGEDHRETVVVADAKNKSEAISQALSKVARKYNNKWQFYVDW
jgi:hypothetical protein